MLVSKDQCSSWHWDLFSGFGTSLFVVSRSWNFSMPNSQLCILAHLKMPSLQFMMFCSFLCVSLKSLPVTMTAALSTKSNIHLPILRSGIFEDFGLEVVKSEGGSSVFQSSSYPFCVFFWDATSSHVVYQSFDVDTQEGSFHIEEEGRGYLSFPPGILYHLRE